jgi:hypothetical protein
MKKNLILPAILLTVFMACKKGDSSLQPQEPPLPPDDSRNVFLKEVVAQSLPNPYFHFTYDDQKYVKQINFASGFAIYKVDYENKRIKKMTNIQNNNSILYSYSNNQVSAVNEFSGQTANKIFSYRFTYNTNQQLSEVLWFDFSGNVDGHLFKKALLTYHADGNLAAIEHYYDQPGGQLTLEKTDRFSNYDNKTNVDDFYLVKDFFDTYLFLPQVKLQKNNPLKQHITGVQNDYEITYTYEYQNNLPVKKVGNMKQTRGTGNGQTLQITNRFNYY